jgi:hypothetical protein
MTVPLCTAEGVVCGGDSWRKECGEGSMSRCVTLLSNGTHLLREFYL